MHVLSANSACISFCVVVHAHGVCVCPYVCLPVSASMRVCVSLSLCLRLCMVALLWSPRYARSSTGGEDYVSASLGAENKGFQVNTASTYTTASTSQRCSNCFAFVREHLFEVEPYIGLTQLRARARVIYNHYIITCNYALHYIITCADAAGSRLGGRCRPRCPWYAQLRRRPLRKTYFV